MNELMIAPERAGPLAMANEATVMDQGVRIANVLKDIIKKQGLISKISGREYVRCEGWTTLGAMLGVVPREREVKDLGDGSYEAYVELVQMSTGNIIGGASAICGTDEAMWKSRPNYARRSRP